MRRLVFLLFVAFSSNSYAEGSDVIYETFTSVQVSKFYDDRNTIQSSNLPDLVDRENKVRDCVDDYVAKQSKTYAKIVQNNLYDLLHDIDKVTSIIYGKRYTGEDKISRDEKLQALGQVQCDAYYSIGVLR